MLDENMNTRLYLLPEKEITSAQYEMIKSKLGVYGPGRQVIKEGTKYFLKSDEPVEDAEARIRKELTDMGEVYPEAA